MALGLPKAKMAAKKDKFMYQSHFFLLDKLMFSYNRLLHGP